MSLVGPEGRVGARDARAVPLAPIGAVYRNRNNTESCQCPEIKASAALVVASAAAHAESGGQRVAACPQS